MKTLSLALVLALSSCGPPPRPVPPPDGPGDCHSACENLKALGGCEIPTDTCESDCAETSTNESALGVRFPVGCLSASKTCGEAEECR